MSKLNNRQNYITRPNRKPLKRYTVAKTYQDYLSQDNL